MSFHEISTKFPRDFHHVRLNESDFAILLKDLDTGKEQDKDAGLFEPNKKVLPFYGMIIVIVGSVVIAVIAALVLARFTRRRILRTGKSSRTPAVSVDMSLASSR